MEWHDLNIVQKGSVWWLYRKDDSSGVGEKWWRSLDTFQIVELSEFADMRERKEEGYETFRNLQHTNNSNLTWNGEWVS